MSPFFVFFWHPLWGEGGEGGKGEGEGGRGRGKGERRDDRWVIRKRIDE